MLSRQSIAPRQSLAPTQNRQSQSQSSTLKSRQLSHLNSQLAQLEANIADMSSLLSVTMVQAEYIRKLGIHHGALFMASHKVFEHEAMNGQEFDEQ